MPRRFLALVLCSLLGLIACKREAGSGPAPAASVRRAPVPAPAGLIADLVIQKPSKNWTDLRALGGGPAQLLPENFQLLLATVLGLSPLAADSIDVELAIFGAVLQEAASGPSLVLGIHVSDGRELTAKLTTGNAPSFRAETADPSGLVGLTALKAESRTIELGIIDNYLVAGKRTALSRAGAYVARTLPARPLPATPISLVAPKTALAGPLAGAIRQAWQARRVELEAADKRARDAHGGRAPDFADPAAVIGAVDALMQNALSVLTSADRLELGAEPAGDGLKMKLELTPAPGGAAEALGQAMKVGGVEALRKLPKGTRAALLLHNEVGKASGEEQPGQGVLALFGERLSADESRRMKEVFVDWEAARGEIALYATVSEPAPAIVFFSQVRDAQRFNKSARGAFDLLKLPSIAEPLQALAGTPKVALSRVRVSGIDREVERASLTFKRPKGTVSLLPDKIEVLWLTGEAEAYAAAGSSAAPALAGLIAAAHAEQGNLGQDAWLESAAKRGGDRIAAALWVDLAALVAGTGPGSGSPLLLLVGKDAARTWFSLEASKAAVEILLRATMGR